MGDATNSRGGSWGADDTIIYSPSAGLARIPAAGGTPQVITTLDRSKGEVRHSWPQLLPGGRAVLFTISTGVGWDEYHAAVLRLDTGEQRIVVRGALMGRVMPSGPLVYYHAGTLLAVPFDLERLEVTDSPPMSIAEDVRFNGGQGGAAYDVSTAGSLAYINAGPGQFERRMLWVDRAGRVNPLPAPPGDGEIIDLSPDGQKLAVAMVGATSDIWIYDVGRGTMTRLTSGEAGSSTFPIWTADGKRMVYRGTRVGFRNLFWRASDGTGLEQRLTTGENLQTAESVSPDGKWLTYRDLSPVTGNDIWLLSLEGERKAQPLVQTRFGEGDSAISPDGRWLAYNSNESGRNEVCVQPFPGPGAKTQISTEGGSQPKWARIGRELIFRQNDKMMVVEITTTPAFSVGKAKLLFEVALGDFYGVTRDGERFIGTQPVEPEQPATQINVLLNWFEELKQKVPVKQ